ncbi:helix-turn-helix domain-containing protein [Burkholderia cepacia]|uniref:helix-turn-helix domain-containing protein n=1 Tax=Burkholderia cepacia TaxID=292 RepID=UPI00158E297F|nr:helix-turn-helix transcriptional regulator [Burkholderia cepacia]
MNSTTTLAERLVQARTRRGLLQGEAAGLAGLSQQGYSELERGVAKTTTRIGTLAYVLGVDAYWLETGLGQADGANDFTGEERKVIEILRNMAPVQRKGLMTVILGLAK